MEFLDRARVAEPTVRAERLASLVHQTFGVQVHPRRIERQFLRKKNRNEIVRVGSGPCAVQ
jgi:hypothetical protein